MWRRIALGLLVVVTTVAAPAATYAINVSSLELDEVTLINRYRAQAGLERLTVDATLTEAAEWMSADMAAKHYFSHTDSLGRDPFQRLVSVGYPENVWRGENLAAGNADPQPTFEQWRNSPGHNANMLNPNYRAIGIARHYDAASPYGYYWTTTFGSEVTSEVSPDGTFGIIRPSTPTAGPTAVESAAPTTVTRRKAVPAKVVKTCRKLKSAKKHRTKKYRAMKCQRILAQYRAKPVTARAAR